MNEIALQIIEIGKLIGKKVFIRHLSEGKFYNDNEVAEIFSIDDFEYYSYYILCGVIELIDNEYKPKFGKYYLVTFKDL